jgi:hypothetical protein
MGVEWLLLSKLGVKSLKQRCRRSTTVEKRAKEDKRNNSKVVCMDGIQIMGEEGKKEERKGKSGKLGIFIEIKKNQYAGGDSE